MSTLMNTEVSDQMKMIEKKFNARSLRERILITGTLLIVIYFIWYTVFYSYLLATDEEVNKNLQSLKSQISQLEGQIDTISEVVGRNPTSQLIEQTQVFKAENEALNQKISAYVAKMVPATEMDDLLNNIIQKTIGLTVLNLENLDVKPLFEAKNVSVDPKNPTFQVFNHGIKIELMGTYFDTLRFLKALEQKKLNVIWESFSYEVTTYPKAKISIELDTLSLSEESINV